MSKKVSKVEGDVDWSKECRGDGAPHSYVYPLARTEPEAVGKMMREAVSLRLRPFYASDEDLAREPEVVQERHLASLHKEAEAQAQRARDYAEGKKVEGPLGYDFPRSRFGDVILDRPFSDVISFIHLMPSLSDSEAILLSCKELVLGEKKGLPYFPIAQDYDTRDGSQHISPLAWMKTTADKLGLDGTRVVQDVYDRHQDDHFGIAIREHDPDAHRAALNRIWDPPVIGLTVAQLYEQLRLEARQAVQQPRFTCFLDGTVKTRLQHGNTPATLEFYASTPGEVWYDPERKQMAGRATPNKEGVLDRFGVRLRPQIGLRTTDDDLLALRDEAIEVCREVGFVEKPFVME